MISTIRLICGGIVLLLFTTTTQANHGEVQLRNFTPTVKTVNISLQGAQSVMPQLERIYQLISQVLQSSKLHVVRVPTTEDPSISMIIPVAENLDIHISMPTPDDIKAQSYLFYLRTQLANQPEQTQRFTYFTGEASALYQSLQDYFVQLLDLQVEVTEDNGNVSTQPITSLDSPEHDVTQASGIQYNLPRTYDTDPHPVISDVLNTQRVVALPVESLEPIQVELTEEPKPEPIQVQQPIAPQKEIELRNMTPAVKSVEIRLRGSVREKQVLDDIHVMVSEILQTSRLSVIRVPVIDKTTTTPAIKLYENLEIIIQATSPETEDKPYLIQLSFQEKDKGYNVQQQSFEYTQTQATQFYEQLRAYMSEHINLSPRYQTQ